MRVLKFGGKSLSCVEKTQNICKYIKKIYKNEKKIIIIVSARGKTTDELIAVAKQYGYNNSPRELAKLLSIGEIESASLFAIMLNNMNIPAKSFSAYELNIKVFGNYLNGKISYINKQPLLDCLNNQTIAIVAGFQGVNSNNEISTLGRGGSDTTAAAIGAIFDTNAEIYSDFSGIFCGDPRFLNYKKIKKANFQIMKQLANSGAKVLDSRAISIAENFNINIIAKSSSQPNKQGTLISKTNIESDFINLSTLNNLCKVSINFSNELKLKFIIKNVLLCLNNINFYNLNIKSNQISFIINNENQLKVVSDISKKLKLLKEKD